jgi:hypothetical protein
MPSTKKGRPAKEGEGTPPLSPRPDLGEVCDMNKQGEPVIRQHSLHAVRASGAKQQRQLSLRQADRLWPTIPQGQKGRREWGSANGWPHASTQTSGLSLCV